MTFTFRLINIRTGLKITSYRVCAGSRDEALAMVEKSASRQYDMRQIFIEEVD